MTTHTTIAAIATPIGSSGGIGIVRISGEEAFKIGQKIFRTNNSALAQNHHVKMVSIEKIKSHRLYYGKIVDPENEALVDEALVTFMRKPKTYTKEDVVEIQSHCGTIVLNKILETILKCGAIAAGPGEFTKRAFLNGRIDLTQAESVIDIINAKSQKSLLMASRHLQGHFKHKINRLKEKINRTRILLEAQIEFGDEIEENEDIKNNINRLYASITPEIEEIISHFRDADIYREGVKLVVAGRTNVGKSSLLNILLNKNRAIVTSIPGTTRDVVEDVFTIKGIPILISDTAGIRDTRDPVEIIGIRKAEESLDKADLILFVIDALTLDIPSDLKLMQKYAQKNLIVVINKTDALKASLPEDKLFPELKVPEVRISVLEEKGIQELKNLMVQNILKEDLTDSQLSAAPNLRQKEILEKVRDRLKSASKLLGDIEFLDSTVMDLNEAEEQLSSITGSAHNRDVYEQIFDTFCIGK